ncbi:hypothetical protein ACRALDRAFT_2064848, partial [Sodiomyces alcalophilus JCM 7366]|uniref:uncharacterized protein n=1 Tax=Sodiomyces alcalophilus JCM 7366 TaxID=591952 RepID=UPI0039B66C88
LYTKLSKYKFYYNRIDFLGFVVTREGIAIDPERIYTVAKWLVPETTRRRSDYFLGFTNYYRIFIYDFIAITAPLIVLIKKDRLFRWGAEEDTAFKELK